MADIFLSYNREDQARARLFAEAFEAAQLSVWWDVTLRSGEAYDEVTEAALRGAKAVVVLWSKRSVVSRWVRAEATIADRCRTLLPAMIEACERPIMFELTQTADLIEWHGDTNAPVWLDFLADLRRMLARGAAPAEQAAAEQRADLSPVLQATARERHPRASHAHRPTLGILPFTNRSGDPADEFFGEAIAEDVTAALAVGRGLRVLAYGTMASLRGQVIDVRRIGQDHGVDYIMEGNVRRLGETLRVTAQLVDSHSGTILWTQKFDRPSQQQAALLDDLVADVSAHLGVKIQNIEMDRAQKQAEPTTAYDAVKRSWAAIPKFTIAGLEKAVAAARQGLALAPGYALAESSLALALGLRYQRGGSLEPALLSEALDHAKRALALDENHPTVLFQLSLIKSFSQQWDESLVLARRSVDLNPHMPEALQTLAGALIRFARYDEALALLDEADRMAPRGFMYAVSLCNRCWLEFGAGRTEAAIAVATKILANDPRDRNALLLRASHYAELGELDLACRDMIELRETAPDEPLELFINTILTSRQTDPARARNAALFRQVWELTTPELAAPQAVVNTA